MKKWSCFWDPFAVGQTAVTAAAGAGDGVHTAQLTPDAVDLIPAQGLALLACSLRNACRGLSLVAPIQ